MCERETWLLVASLAMAAMMVHAGMTTEGWFQKVERDSTTMESPSSFKMKKRVKYITIMMTTEG